MHGMLPGGGPILRRFCRSCLRRLQTGPYSWWANTKRRFDLRMGDEQVAEAAAGGELNYVAADTVKNQADVLIIGGGAVGLAAAYWLKFLNPRVLTITLVEKDPTCEKNGSYLSLGGVRQQFTLPENVLAARFGADFFRCAPEFLALKIDEQIVPDVLFNPQGYLFLANEAEDARRLTADFQLQSDLGVKLDLMTAPQLAAKFPWLNTDDILVGNYGLEDEGWLDPHAYMDGMRDKARSMGVRYLNGKVVGFKGRFPDTNLRLVNKCFIKQAEDEGSILEFDFHTVVNCAGVDAPEIASMFGIASRRPGYDELGTSVPVQPRKRCLYVVRCPEGGPGLECPLLVDPSGVYMRREGTANLYVCGYCPPPEDELDPLLPGVSDNYFEDKIRPHLVHRIPAFENAFIEDRWSGLIDYNTFDQNMIVGPHPVYPNHILACGFSGVGMQMSPAVGRAIMELVFYKGKYHAMDFTKFGFKRIVECDPLEERPFIV